MFLQPLYLYPMTYDILKELNTQVLLYLQHCMLSRLHAASITGKHVEWTWVSQVPAPNVHITHVTMISHI